MTHSTALVVVSYATHEQTADYVRHFRAIVGPWPTVVVNNGPFNEKGDEASLESLRGAGVDVIRAERNLGYGAGNNLALRHIRESYPAVGTVLVSNNDVIVGNRIDRFCAEAAAVLDADSKLIAVGPRVVARGTGKAQSPKYEYPPMRSILYHVFYPISFLLEGLRREVDSLRQRPFDVFGLNGSFWMFSLRRFAEIGDFDESTFLYWEEEIVGKKAKDRGLRITMMPQFRVVHDHGSTVRSVLSLKAYYRTFARSYRRYISLYRPGIWRTLAAETAKHRMLVALLGKLVGSLLVRIRRA